MTLALTAKITCDPKRVLESRWAHDTAHALRASVLKARGWRSRRGRASKN